MCHRRAVLLISSARNTALDFAVPWSYKIAPLISISQCATPESAAMGRSVLAAALVLTALLVVQLPAGELMMIIIISYPRQQRR